MNYKNKVCIAAILIVVLITGLFLWYFSSRSVENQTPQIEQLTEEQKLDILSQIHSTSTVVIPDSEKLNVLNNIHTNATTSFSSDEKLKILNKTN